ncbi:ROK family transcriptional regulator [Actinoplanes sp. L3-i22]|uniref:ROK family transcriptional regulator n=1 Tax=Actinoplanes sp. L3-i22 TaxID=2836373 RepID=UPI001C7710F6|nr:ROK family transcriptional regulator [Actinoplanes sp. L3-i22]BCY08979.1 sugar kinase [Actinoplanes sp. L3-i22]
MTRPVHRVAPATDAPIRQDSLRAHNLILTFQQIVGAQQTPVSRSELAATTGLTRPTISRIVDELLTAGLIVETEPARSGNSGRPRVGLGLARTGPAGLGLDIRADALSVCVVDLTGTVRHLDFAARPHHRPQPEQTLRDLAAMAGDAITAAAAEQLTVVGATLAVPGAVEAGVIRSAPALGWHDVDAGAALSRLIAADDLPVLVDKDASLAALGELYAAGPELRDFVCVTGEFDIGAGLVLGGTPLGAARGWAGELGHVMVDSAGPACVCGATGCLQCYAGLQQILAAVPGNEVSGQPYAVAIDALVSAGSPQIMTALDRAATALGVAISAVLNLVNVRTVLLGGNYSLLTSWLADGIQRELDHRVRTASWTAIEVRPAPLGPDAAVIGAALSAVDRVRRDPNPWLARRRQRAAAG